jgi:hypothetical protein
VDVSGYNVVGPRFALNLNLRYRQVNMRNLRKTREFGAKELENLGELKVIQPALASMPLIADNWSDGKFEIAPIFTRFEVFLWLKIQ